MLSADTTDSSIMELSISEWFYRNRNIAGFDNPARSLYVSIREIFENSMDACENAGVLPKISVRLKNTSASIDEEIGVSSGPQIFELEVRDNGSGMSRENIPKLIGKMLSGTKFQNKQSRGTFGLGGSLALLYGQITTQKPIIIHTGQKGLEFFYRVSLKLDIEKNRPIILDEVRIPKEIDVQGTVISFNLRGDWLRSKRRVIEYFIQTSIIVPYATISFEPPDGEVITFTNLVEDLPRTPIPMKPHPRGVDVEMLKQMISTTKKSTLRSFMIDKFQRVGASSATEFLAFVGFNAEMPPRDLTTDDLVRIVEAMDKFGKFRSPSAHSLSPAGEDVLLAGMTRLSPEFSMVKQRPPNVHGGHPFIIETGVSYGGELESGVILFRFANRIPLLYDERNDVSSRVLRNLNLRNYNLRKDDPLAFFVHICSTRIPYKTVGKEYIADVDVVRREIELGFKDCLRRLSECVRKRRKGQQIREREDKLFGYYKFIAATLSEITNREVTLDKLFTRRGEL